MKITTFMVSFLSDKLCITDVTDWQRVWFLSDVYPYLEEKEPG